MLISTELHPLCLLQVSKLSSRDLLASPESEQLFNIKTVFHPGKIWEHEVDKKLEVNFSRKIRIRSR